MGYVDDERNGAVLVRKLEGYCNWTHYLAPLSSHHHPRHLHLAPAVASGMSHDLCGATMAEDLLLVSVFAFYRKGPKFPGSV